MAEKKQRSRKLNKDDHKAIDDAAKWTKIIAMGSAAVVAIGLGIKKHGKEIPRIVGKLIIK